MDTVSDFIKAMNTALHSADLNSSEFESVISSFIHSTNAKILIVDFAERNTDQLKHAKTEKIKEVKAQNFEFAASWREKEKLILSYIELKKDFGIEESRFQLVDDYLFYYHLGTALNDKAVKEIVERNISTK